MARGSGRCAKEAKSDRRVPHLSLASFAEHWPSSVTTHGLEQQERSRPLEAATARTGEVQSMAGEATLSPLRSEIRRSGV
jgi:hypothetical protein